MSQASGIQLNHLPTKSRRFEWLKEKGRITGKKKESEQGTELGAEGRVSDQCQLAVSEQRAEGKTQGAKSIYTVAE